MENGKIKKLWIDESGDCGFKFSKGSSRFLVIVVVYLTSEKDIDKPIRKIKENLGLSEDYEFKFSRSKKETRKEFNSVLNKYLSKNIISKIRQKRSKNDAMIQVADMISGSIFRKYAKDDDQYYKMIESKEKIFIKF